MQEDHPFLPGVVEGAFQLFDVVHDAEAAAGVRMLERVGLGRGMAWKRRRSAGSQFQQRLGGLVWQMVGKIEEAVVVGAAYIGQPLGRYTVVQQFFIGNVGKGERSGLLYLHVDRDLDLLDRLAHFDQLGRAGPGVGLQPALPRPAVGAVVVIDVAEQEAVLCAVNDDADVRTDAH